LRELCYQPPLSTSSAVAGKGEHDKRAGERVAKVIARAGLASRRQAEQWIAAGRVAVNGTAITSPAVNVTQQDRVTVDGQPLPHRERTRLFLYHKPRGQVTTHSDPQNRPTVFDALPKHLPRLISIGRLDFNTQGLLLLTNDGGLARVLELPDTGWLRRYRVRAHGKVTQEQLDRLRGGIELDGVRYGPIEATLDREQGANVWLTFAIREGKNREVRNVLAHLGLQVNRLIRTSFGPFQLGQLPEGAVEEVRTRVLREQLGERIAASSAVDFTAPRKDIPPMKGRVGERGSRPGRHAEVRARSASLEVDGRAPHDEPGWGDRKPRPAAAPARSASQPSRKRVRDDKPKRRRAPRRYHGKRP
jgi:23S rRNA pseudouridine2605 synthase